MSRARSAIPADDERLPADTAFELLTNPRRRRVLAALAERSPLTLGELAERIAARERGISRAELSSKQRKSVYTSLYQTHLPKLADAGLVEYDRDRGVVVLAERADQLGPYLRPTRASDRLWSRRFMALALACGGLLGINELAGRPLPPLGVAAGFVLLFCLLTFAYVRAPR